LKKLGARVVCLLVVLLAVLGCGNSSDVYVYTGASQGAGTVSGANQVLLSVTVPSDVSGAQPLSAAGQSGVSVRTVARGEQVPNGDYTLPGALCRAYDLLGQTVATVVVSSQGTVKFDTLPPGVYRFVVTNYDAAVVLEVIASASVSGPTVVDANSISTAAVLVTLAAGKGSFDLETYSHALAIDLAQLILLVEAQIANPGDPWITADGKTVVDPAVKNAVEAAVRSLPGKGKFVHGGDLPQGYGAGVDVTSSQSAVGNPPAGDPPPTDTSLGDSAPGQSPSDGSGEGSAADEQSVQSDYGADQSDAGPEQASDGSTAEAQAAEEPGQGTPQSVDQTDPSGQPTVR
jgi:hypothetical protein